MTPRIEMHPAAAAIAGRPLFRHAAFAAIRGALFVRNPMLDGAYRPCGSLDAAGAIRLGRGAA